MSEFNKGIPENVMHIAPSINIEASEIKSDIRLQSEVKIPRAATFANIEVKEDLDVDMLTEEERKLYKRGMSNLEQLVGAADNNVSKMVLTTPEMVSGIVGLQPLASMRTGEAVLTYQAFKRAGIDFDQGHSFIEFGKERDYLKIFVNDRAVENTLRTYQEELDIHLADRQLEKEEILTNTIQLLNNPNAKKANLAHGLLSGFPLEDCQSWVNGEGPVNLIPQLKKAQDLDNRFLNETPIAGSNKVMRINPISLLEPEDYAMSSSKNYFLPDTRATVSQGTTRGSIEGFGVRWVAPLPARESTIKHAQRLLQVNREVGLLDFVNKQRATFSIEDNIKIIATQKELLEGMAPGKVELSPLIDLAAGIFVVFAKALREVIKPD